MPVPQLPDSAEVPFIPVLALQTDPM